MARKKTRKKTDVDVDEFMKAMIEKVRSKTKKKKKEMLFFEKLSGKLIGYVAILVVFLFLLWLLKLLIMAIF